MDHDFESMIVVRKDANISTSADLSQRKILTRTRDSPQAHVVPLYHLQQEKSISFSTVTSWMLIKANIAIWQFGEIQAI